MKKIHFFLLAALAAASCSEIAAELNTPADTLLVQKTFTAMADGLTKTTLGDDFGVRWSTEDPITVFAGENAAPQTFTVESISAEGRIATFTGLTAVSPTYYAIVPAQTDATISGGIVTATFPTVQTAVAGGFGPKANLAIAKSGTDDLQFLNVGAIVGVKVNESGLTSIRLEGAGAADVLSGKVSVNYGSDNPSFTVVDGKNYVELTGSFTSGQTYYFVVLPGTYASGLKLVFSKPGLTATLTNSKSLTLTRSGHAFLGDITIDAAKWVSDFTVGEKVYIKGLSAAEDGQEVTYIGSGYLNTSLGNAGDLDIFSEAYNYEVWAKLEAGQGFYLETASGVRYGISADGTTVAPIAADAVGDFSPASTDPYRIRVNLPSGEASVARVAGLEASLLYTEGDWKYFTTDNSYYVGRGQWTIPGIQIKWGVQSWDAHMVRYRLKIRFNRKGNTDIDSWQPYGSVTSHGAAPTAQDPSDSYFFMQPFKGDDWSEVFYFSNDMWDANLNGRYLADLNFYMNADYGHFTHSFSNITDTYVPVTSGDPLYIGGAGAEAGQQFTFLASDYYEVSATDTHKSFGEGLVGYYEIYTQLTAGQPYYFYTDAAFYNPTTLETAADAAAAGVNVAADGIYRIRVDLDGKKVGLLKIEKLLMAYEWNRSDPSWQWEIPYQGKGIWKLSELVIRHHDWDNPARYNFHMLFSSDFSNRQVWGRNQSLEGQPAADAAQSVFDLQPRETKEWPGREMKFPVNLWDSANSGRYKADLTVYFNNDLGHYTHTFTNIVDTL